MLKHVPVKTLKHTRQFFSVNPKSRWIRADNSFWVVVPRLTNKAHFEWISARKTEFQKTKNTKLQIKRELRHRKQTKNKTDTSIVA